MNANQTINYQNCEALLKNDFFTSEYFTKINENINVHIEEESFLKFFLKEHDIKINTSFLTNCDLSMLKNLRKMVLVFQGNKEEQFQLSYDLIHDIQEYGNEDLDLLLGYHNSKYPIVTMIYV
ncbi:MAG: hypothetical protein COA66_00635 [Arcobacter sp.]|nr:MAG: hypothetical protein COA66_00635 [Arcobacter sp.]